MGYITEAEQRYSFGNTVSHSLTYKMQLAALPHYIVVLLRALSLNHYSLPLRHTFD